MRKRMELPIFFAKAMLYGTAAGALVLACCLLLMKFAFYFSELIGLMPHHF